RNPGGEIARDGEIQVRVAVQIAQRHSLGSVAGAVDHRLGEERAVSRVGNDQDGGHALAEDGEGEVQVRVAVHVTQRHPGRIEGHGVAQGEQERAVAVVLQNREAAAVVVGDGDVEVGVPVKVAERHGARVLPGGKWTGGRKGAITVVAQHRHVV